MAAPRRRRLHWPGFVPVIGRELQVASRAKGTYWFRLVVGASAVAPALLGVVFLVGRLPDSLIGVYLFRYLTWSAAMCCLLAGLETADCISRERREGTLGLLFLTDLKGLDVVLGKIAASSLVSGYTVLATLPVMGFPIILGGVTVIELVNVALLLLNLLLFSLAAGVAVSSVSLVERKAAGGTLLVIALWCSIPYLPDAINAPPLWIRMAACASPVTAAKFVFVGFQQQDFWASMGLTLLSSLALLGFAARRTVRAWRDKQPGRVERWWHNVVTPAGQAARRQRGLNINPIYWLWERKCQRGTHPVVILGMMVGLMVWTFVVGGFYVMGGGLVLVWGVLLNFILKLWVLGSVVGLYNNQRKSGALELVLSTPLSVERILSGTTHWLGRRFRWVLVAAVLAELGLAVVAAGIPSYGFEDRWQASLTWLIGQALILVPDCWALAWVGMQLSLTKKNTGIALLGTTFRLSLIPWGATFFAALLSILYDGSEVVIQNNAFAAWFVASLIVDVGFGWHARTNLLRHFRRHAADPPWARTAATNKVVRPARG